MQVGVGWSDAPDSRAAVREALAGASSAVSTPDITFLFTTDQYDQHAVLTAVQERGAPSRIVGLCGAGIITPQGVMRQGIGIATVSSPGLRVVTSLYTWHDEDPRAAGRRAAAGLLASGIGNGLVVVLPDGFAPNAAETLQGLYNGLGPDFSYIGGGAGDNLRFFQTFQFTEAGVRSGAAAVALIEGLPFSTAIGHGWTPQGELLVLTRATRKMLYEIDARPAFEVYSERLGGIARNDFAQVAMRHPIGIPDVRGNYLIRDPIAVHADGSLEFATEVPVNAVAHIMEGNAERLLSAAGDVARRACAGVRVPRFALVFDCISRALFLGEAFDREIQRLRHNIGETVPFLGALTFGEIGGETGLPSIHNKTLALAVFGDPGLE